MAVLLSVDELVRQLTEAEARIIALEKRHVYDYSRLAVALRELPLNDTTLQAIAIICRVLKEQNPRFDAGTFGEWALEGK